MIYCEGHICYRDALLQKHGFVKGFDLSNFRFDDGFCGCAGAIQIFRANQQLQTIGLDYRFGIFVKKKAVGFKADDSARLKKLSITLKENR